MSTLETTIRQEGDTLHLTSQMHFNELLDIANALDAKIGELLKQTDDQPYQRMAVMLAAFGVISAEYGMVISADKLAEVFAPAIQTNAFSWRLDGMQH